jgi:dsRNA-specific ribonuclease
VSGPAPPGPRVRDARGRTSQRLEFLGDSALDLTLATHVAVEPDCPACPASPRRGDPARLVTDRRLAERARAHGMGDWLEWEASDDRLADLVETAVAAVERRFGASVLELAAAADAYRRLPDAALARARDVLA